jgi:hypothetical protein
MAFLPAGLMVPILHPGSTTLLLGQGVAGAEPQRWWDVLRHDVIPVAAAYVVFLALLITYYRATRRGNEPTGHRAAKRWGVRPAGGAPGWGDLVRYLAGVAAGGYVFFLSIVVVFYFVLGGEDPEFIRQALVEGSLLTFALVVPAFLLFSHIEDLRSRRRAARH